MRRMVVGSLLIVGMLVMGASQASAAPKTGFPVTVVCPSGTYEAMAVPGQGEWVPAIVTDGDRRVLHPVGFENFYARVINPDTNEVVAEFGDDETGYRETAFRHPHGFERCGWSSSFVIGPDDEDGFPEGFIGEIGGEVLVRSAPPRR